MFAEAAIPSLRIATLELSWLLTRGYNVTSAATLVGNRHALRSRQRLAVTRAACSDAEQIARAANRVDPTTLAGEVVLIDGFNSIIALEAALSGGVLIVGRDGALRDMASVHGSYRRVQETERALDLVAAFLRSAGCSKALFWLDQPVSNSGRLAQMIRDRIGGVIETEALLSNNPDRELRARAAEGVVCSGDAFVIDGAPRWLDLPAAVIESAGLDVWRVDLRGANESTICS